MKIVLNKCFGGFLLSEKAIKAAGLSNGSCDIDKLRVDPRVVKVVEDLGQEASGEDARLEVCEIPDAFRDTFVVSELEGYEEAWPGNKLA